MINTDSGNSGTHKRCPVNHDGNVEQENNSVFNTVLVQMIIYFAVQSQKQTRGDSSDCEVIL